MLTRLALALGLLALGGPLAAGLRVVLPPPSPLPTAWRVGGLVEEDFSPETWLGDLDALGPPGRAVVAACEQPEVLVAFLPSGARPPTLGALLEERGYPEWSTLTRGAPTARWVQGDRGGLVLLRVDRLLVERGGGAPSSLPGLVAHELTHLAQRSWGSLDPGARFHDRADEAEALWIETGVLKRVIRRKRRRGIRPSQAETRLLGVRADAASLGRMHRRVARHPRYRDLPEGPLRDPEHYLPDQDPFRHLWEQLAPPALLH